MHNALAPRRGVSFGSNALRCAPATPERLRAPASQPAPIDGSKCHAHDVSRSPAARFWHLTVYGEETMDALTRFVVVRSLGLDRFAVLALAFMTGGVIAQTVPGTSNPYLAGMPNGSTCCSGDSAPAQSPVQVGSITVTPGATVTFTASGGVDFAGGAPTSGPDGGFVFTTASSDGISGAIWPVNALVGVFLDDALPTSTPAPADLDFGPTGIGTSFTT